MTLPSLERSLAWMSMFLLIVGLGGILCLLCLWPFFPSVFSRAAAFYSMSCSMILLAGMLDRLLLWRRQRQAQELPADPSASVEEPEHQPDSWCSEVVQIVLETMTGEAYEQIPECALQAVATHGTQGRMRLARHLLEEWRSQGPAETVQSAHADRTRCSVCAGWEKNTLLVTCTRCQQRIHQECSVPVRHARVRKARLCIDPMCRLYCWACLEMLQRQDFILAYDEDGPLLVQRFNKNKR